MMKRIATYPNHFLHQGTFDLTCTQALGALFDPSKKKKKKTRKAKDGECSRRKSFEIGPVVNNLSIFTCITCAESAILDDGAADVAEASESAPLGDTSVW
jgi:hypothetical protein